MYPWQQHHWNRLIAQYQQQRLPHALLLVGAEGLGKLQFAKHLAAHMLCQRVDVLDEACGTCSDCRLLETKAHPDFYDVTLLEKSKSIKVDQIRELNDKLSKTAMHAKRQIAIIHPANHMNRAAANALLKSLEEPVGDVLFILIASQTGHIPATILSRCQRLDFYATADDDTLGWLSSQVSDEFPARSLLKMAGYAPLKAVDLLAEEYPKLRDDLLRDLMHISLKGRNPISQADVYSKLDLLRLLTSWLSIVADCLRLQCAADLRFVVNEDRAEPLLKLANALPAYMLQQFVSELQSALAMLQGAVHVNVQMMLENLLIAWAGMTTTLR